MSQSSSYTEDRAHLVRAASAYNGAFFAPYDDLIKRRSEEIVQAARAYFDACEDGGHDGRTRVEWELATAKTQAARERLRLLVKDASQPIPTADPSKGSER